MKKKFMKVLAAALVAGMALTGCGGSGEQAQEPAGEETAMVYAVELGSAGEAAAKHLCGRKVASLSHSNLCRRGRSLAGTSTDSELLYLVGTGAENPVPYSRAPEFKNLESL
ncbi:MAG: hypothetical protein IJ936_00190 [Peptococcaceae bacterium]|nr:hypothetical protein [Peptococcaceae bacterium]